MRGSGATIGWLRVPGFVTVTGLSHCTYLFDRVHSETGRDPQMPAHLTATSLKVAVVLDVVEVAMLAAGGDHET